MVFDLFDDPSDGTSLGSSGPFDVSVDQGLFTQELDFGADVFSDEARWLQITVEGTTLSPRQEITGTPYANHEDGQRPNI